MIFAFLLAAAAAAAPCPPTWTYQDQAAWPDQYCKSGKLQSPINIGPRVIVDRDLPAIKFKYKPFPLSVWNTARYYEVPRAKNCTIEIGKAHYRLDQFHFHVPSEHTVNGVGSAAELHLVHKSTGRIVAVAVFLVESPKANPALDPIVRLAKQVAACHTLPSSETIDPLALLPKTRTYVTYEGSLTTPDCIGRVRFYVMNEPIYASREQIQALGAIGPSARDRQPLNGRVPKKSVR
jgi:carbonic anhydrase